MIFSHVLYQLSYRGICIRVAVRAPTRASVVVGDTGLEPVNLLGVSEALSQLS